MSSSNEPAPEVANLMPEGNSTERQTQTTEEAPAAAAPPPRLIESLHRYMWPLALFWLFNMFQWSEDEPNNSDLPKTAGSVKEVAASPSPPPLSAVPEPDHSPFEFFTNFVGSLFNGGPSDAGEARMGGSIAEDGFLSRTGILGDFIIIVAVVLAVGLWKASWKVETGALEGAEGQRHDSGPKEAGDAKKTAPDA